LKVIETNIIHSRMDPFPPPAAPDPGYLRTKAAYHHLIHILDTSLPPPISDTPEARAERNSAAITQIAALCPANAAEAALAAQFVAANAQAMECLRLTQASETPGHLTLKCNAQSASMMRQAQGAMRTLLLAQAARAKRNPDASAWDEQIAGELMAECLTFATQRPAAQLPAAQPEAAQHSTDRPSAAQPPAVQPLAAQLAANRPPTEPPNSKPAPDAEPAPDPVREAETYAIIYPDRAAAIRRAGGLPPGAGFAPPDEPIIRALLAGSTGAPRRPGRMAA
jgi:hypothetical protein